MPDVQPVDGGPLADEALVPSYVLPDLLTCLDGSAVTDGRTWLQVRRPEVLDLFRERMYGRSPDRRDAMSFDVSDHDTGALQGVATRKQVRVCFTGDETGPQMDLLIYPPNDRPRPPTFPRPQLPWQPDHPPRSGDPPLDGVGGGSRQRACLWRTSCR